MAIESINVGSNAYQGRVQGFNSVTADDAVKVFPNNNIKEETKAQVAEDNSEAKEKSSEEIKKAIENINKRANVSAQFHYNEDSKKISVQIVDAQTDKVIKEFPEEKILDMVSKAWEMVGLVVDEQR